MKIIHYPFVLMLLVLLQACGSSAPVESPVAQTPTPGPNPPPEEVSACAVARLATQESDLITGPLARSRLNDFVLENPLMRVIVQKPGRNWLGIAQFGGNIIDAGLRDENGDVFGNDQFEEFILGTNVESSPNYQTVEVLSAGGEDADGNCQPAVIRATGPDDLFEIVNASTIIRAIAVGGVPLQYPPEADDVDLPLTFQTDYTLNATEQFVRVDTTMINDTGNDVSLYLTEYISGSGELEIFQSGYGFGEPFVTAPCDSCRFVVHAGHDGGSGVSYGVIHNVPGTTSVSTVGVTVMLYGRDFLDVVTAPEGTHQGNPNANQNFTVPANGTLVFSRFFAVGDGTVASILESRNAVLGLDAGTLSGQVTDANGPVQNAEIAVLSNNDDFPQNRGPNLLVVNHFRTDAQGNYSGQLPAGDYTLQLNVPGRLAGTPVDPAVTITSGAESTQNFSAPAQSALRVFVNDPNGNGLPAKVQLIGSENSPDSGEPLNSEVVLQALTVTSGVYGDENADPLPPNVVLAEYAVNDGGSGTVFLGDTGELPIEPGDYILSVSRGTRYSEDVQNVTITEGQTTVAVATLAEVVPTPNHLAGDFHVHSFQSLDAEVTDRERVANYVSEGIDFFTPSDHGFRADFSPVIADMNLGFMVASTPSTEMTTMDYGHFNAWPTNIETFSPDSEAPNTGQSTDPKTGQGAVDWGGVAPAGEDFPSLNNFNFTPQQIVAASKNDPVTPGREVVVQINHIEGHFGAGGLAIDTGQTPPVSSTDPTTRRLDPNFDDPDPDIGPGNYYTDSYDSLELWIGTSGVAGQNTAFLGENIGDWFNLLNQGRFHTGVANSDTHDRRISAMHARNIISIPAGLRNGSVVNPPAVSADPHTVADSVLEGLTTMSNAPFLIVKASNANGDQAGLELTDAFGPLSRPLPLADVNEAINLDIQIQSPDWAQFDRISVYVNGETVRHTNDLQIPTEPPRYALCDAGTVLNAPADFTVNTEVVAGTDGRERLTASVNPLSIASPGQDYWFVVRVEGTEGTSIPLWPVVPNDFVDGDDLATRSVDDRGVYSLAVTNPIYVDADGDGSWTPPGVQTHQGTPFDACP